MKPKFQKAIAGFEDKDKGNLPKSRMEKAEMGNKRKKKKIRKLKHQTRIINLHLKEGRQSRGEEITKDTNASDFPRKLSQMEGTH